MITRPAPQAATLAEKLRAAGGIPILFPVIEILAVENLQPFYDVVDRLDEFDIAIFISPNAVSRAMNLIAPRRALPPQLVVAAVGDATVSALHDRGVPSVIAPTHSFDSEALLALPALAQIAGKRVVIFRGEGGREVLGETLRARGAHVHYAECYRRAVPQLDPAPLFDAWRRNGLDAFVVTSSEAVSNLFSVVGAAGEPHLVATPFFVPHARIAGNARRRGVAQVVTTGPGDEGILSALRAHFAPPR